MLPPTVAISLQQRKTVTAETYESVTVYFSDIADFLLLGWSLIQFQGGFIILFSQLRALRWRWWPSSTRCTSFSTPGSTDMTCTRWRRSMTATWWPAGSRSGTATSTRRRSRPWRWTCSPAPPSSWSPTGPRTSSSSGSASIQGLWCQVKNQ